MKKIGVRERSAVRCGGCCASLIAVVSGMSGSSLAGGADCGWSERFGVAGVNAPASTLAPYWDGNKFRLMVNGGFTVAGGTSVAGTASWDGAEWTPVTIPVDPWGGFIHSVASVSLLGTSHVLASVHCYGDGVCDQGAIARWDGTAWDALGQPFVRGGGVPEFFSAHDDGSGVALYAAGRYFRDGGSPVVRLRDGSWEPVGQFEGPSCTTFGSTGLVSFNDGAGARLYITACIGDFFSSVRVLSAWDGKEWISTPLPQTDGPRSLVAVQDGPLRGIYLSGTFLIDGMYHDIIRYDGVSFIGLGASDTGFVQMTVLEFEGAERLYAHGDFQQIGGSSAPYVAHWDGSGWRADAPLTVNGPNGGVSALATLPGDAGDRLVAAGWFAELGGARADNIAIREAQGWRALSPLAQGVAGEVISAATIADSSGAETLYCTGYFLAAGAAISRGHAKFDGTGWTSVEPSGIEYPYAQLFAADTGTGVTLHITGPFPSPSPGRFDNLARLGPNGAWERIESPARAYVEVIATDAAGISSDFMAVTNTVGASPGEGWRRGAARYTAGSWTELVEFEPLSRASGTTDAAWWSDPVLGGLFVSAYRYDSGAYTHRFVRWVDGEWSEIATPYGWRVDRLAVVSSGPARGVYASGYPGDGAFRVELRRLDGDSLVALQSSNGIELAGTSFDGAMFDFGDGAALYAVAEFLFPGFDTPVGALGRWNGSDWHLIERATIYAARGLTKLNDELFVHGLLAGTAETPASGIGSLGCIVRQCPTDITADGGTGMDDLVRVLGMWSQLAIGEPEDVDRDGVVTLADLAELIAHWDERCP